MDHTTNYGLILRELRKRRCLSIQNMALKIGRSAGWLCEVENDKGTSRLSIIEFERIIEILGASNDRPMFKTWIANLKNLERANKVFDGAVLKLMRIKKEITLLEAATKTGFSKGYLSKIENGKKAISLNLRNKIIIAYGYSPASFKNLSTDPVRSTAVPSRFKFQIMLAKLSKQQSETAFKHFLSALQTIQ